MLRKVALMSECDRNKLERIVVEHYKLVNELRSGELTLEKQEEIKKRIKDLIEERDRLIDYRVGYRMD